MGTSSDSSAVLGFLEFEKDAAIYSAKNDMKLWQGWVDGGKQPEDTEKLLTNFKGLIRSQSNKYARTQNIPSSAIHAQFQTQAMHAFDNYDPNRGTKLSTHMTNQMKRARRFVNTYQNIGRIPEPRINKITEFKDARMRLEDDLQRPPSAHELSDNLKWPVKHIVAMEHEIRDEIPASRFPGEVASIKPSKDAEILRLIQYELSPEEKSVFEYSMGQNGKPQLKPGDIAKKLNMQPSKVSRLKLAIANKVGRYRK
jgi:DNA-directed RNA polymerase specialized sigma subunit